MPTLDDVRAALADTTQGFPQVTVALLDYLETVETRLRALGASLGSETPSRRRREPDTP